MHYQADPTGIMEDEMSTKAKELSMVCHPFSDPASAQITILGGTVVEILKWWLEMSLIIGAWGLFKRDRLLEFCW